VKKSIIVSLLVLLPALVSANAGSRLSAQQIDEVKVIKNLTKDVEKKSVEQIVADLNNTSDPHLNLSIKSAIAKTYADIVKEQQVVGKPNKDWLYSMVSLNMAYLRFGGGTKASSPLDGLIRRKLSEHLQDTKSLPGFNVSID
jgi:hypothetical protein